MERTGDSRLSLQTERRNAIRWRRLALVLAATACGKQSAAPGPVTGPEASTCDTLVPAEVRDGMAMTGSRFEAVLGCTLSNKRNEVVGAVAFECGLDAAEAEVKLAASAGKPIVGLGRFGFSEAHAARVTTYATNADCLVRVTRTAPKAIEFDPAAVAKVVEANLTATNMPKPDPIPPGGAGMHCDRYVPQALRDQYRLVRTKQAYAGDQLLCNYQTPTSNALRLVLACFPDRKQADARLVQLQTAANVGSGTNDVAFAPEGTSCAALLTSFAAPLADAQHAITSAITPASIK